MLYLSIIHCRRHRFHYRRYVFHFLFSVLASKVFVLVILGIFQRDSLSHKGLLNNNLFNLKCCGVTTRRLK